MQWLNENAGAVQAVATIALVILTGLYATITLALANRAREQVKVMRETSQANAAISLVRFLQEPDVRKARATVRGLAPTKDWIHAWSPDEQSAASLVCSSYDVAGILITHQLVLAAPLITNWGPSLAACFDACEPFIQDMRQSSGPTYWSNFETIVGMVPEELRAHVRRRTAADNDDPKERSVPVE